MSSLLFPSEGDRFSYWMDEAECDNETLPMSAEISLAEQLEIDGLAEQGFTWEESLRLFNVRLQVREPATSDEEAGWDEAVFLNPVLPLDCSIEDQLAIESLVEQGFTWEEGLGLVGLRERITAITEWGEHPRLQFARWLYQHGHLSESLA